ncbi:hypothetical protein CPC08DRAFT_717497 [Agrocybe pediades]|nr:hypothetical protein CPC08DRAFT_717497 [Agrocybe pediades]
MTSTMATISFLIGPAPSHSTTGREVRTIGGHVQKEVLVIALPGLAEEEQACSPGNQQLFT